jgi:hypothetical protein
MSEKEVVISDIRTVKVSPAVLSAVMGELVHASLVLGGS